MHSGTTPSSLEHIHAPPLARMMQGSPLHLPLARMPTSQVTALTAHTASCFHPSSCAAHPASAPTLATDNAHICAEHPVARTTAGYTHNSIWIHSCAIMASYLPFMCSCMRICRCSYTHLCTCAPITVAPQCPGHFPLQLGLLNEPPAPLASAGDASDQFLPKPSCQAPCPRHVYILTAPPAGCGHLFTITAAPRLYGCCYPHSTW